MKLAEALQERADLNRKIAELTDRLSTNALVQEGEKPLEDPAALLKELDKATARLGKLMAQINRTNSAAVVEGKTITERLAERDALTLQLSSYRSLIEAASQNTRRARGTEIKILPTVDVAALQKKADAMAKKLRENDNLLQQANWTTELCEG